MSLINEALKRAESEKARQSGPPDPAASPPSWPSPEGGATTLFSAPRQTGLRGALILGGCVLAVVGGVMYFSLPPPRQAQKPAPSVAAARLATPAAPATPLPATAPSPGAGTSLSEIGSGIQSALGKTFRSLHSYRPSAASADLAERTPGPPAPAPPAAAPRPPATASVTPPEPPAAPVQAPQPAPARLDASQFRLGGVMESSGGAHAIINDHLVAIGDEVDGAKVVSIRKGTVVLEKDGQRLTLRL